MKIIVSFSGGKDSQACLIQAANKYGTNKIEAVFCDTGWEHPDTYQHISDVCKQLDRCRAKDKRRNSKRFVFLLTRLHPQPLLQE